MLDWLELIKVKVLINVRKVEVRIISEKCLKFDYQ